MNTSSIAYNSSTTDFDRPESWVTPVKCGTLIVIFVLTISSNSFVLWAVLSRGGSRKKTQTLSRVQLFMVNLSIADILVGLLNILPQLVWDMVGNFLGDNLSCKLVKYVQVFVLYLSTYVLTGMSIDRLVSMRAIKSQWEAGMTNFGDNKKSTRNTFNNHRSRISYRRFAKCLIVIAWAISALLALPQVFIFSYVVTDKGSDCRADFSMHEQGQKIYVVGFVVIILGIPALVMFYCYAYICFIILQIQRGYRSTSIDSHDGAASNAPPVPNSDFQMSTERITRAKMRMIKMTLAVVVCFIICQTPYCLAQLVLSFAHDSESVSHVSPIHMVLLLLAALNSTMNPWIYAAFSTNGVGQNKSCTRRGFQSTETTRVTIGEANGKH